MVKGNSKLNNKEALEEAVRTSVNFGEVLNKMGYITGAGSYKMLYKYLDLFKIDYSYLKDFKKQRGRSKPIEDLLNNKSKLSSTDLKNRLYKIGLKQRQCELCGQGEEWQGKKMSLILDHINGINNDNRLENLQIVCPNCDATLDTYKGRNNKKGRLKLINIGKPIIEEKREEKRKMINKVIQNKEVDFSKSNWGNRLGKLINLHSTNARLNMKLLFPEFYLNECFKR